ncbi:Calx-beta domain-containing protein [Anaerolineales bacterium HSG25]|nr:Calx-beta domain-containing protein [Anaerolineales bacterium HSG25]
MIRKSYVGNLTLLFLIELLFVLTLPMIVMAQAPIDFASDSVYDDDWDNGDNGGTGFNGWSLTSGSNSDHFTSTSINNGGAVDSNGDGDINTGGGAWGMYANSGDTATAVRTFANTLDVGASFSIDMDNGYVDGGGTVGFGLQNSSGENLTEFYFVGEGTNYTLNDNAGATDTGIGFTDEGLSLVFTLTSASTYDVQITYLKGNTVTNFTSRSLSNPGGGQTVSQVRLFNANAYAGVGLSLRRDVFFNNLEISAPDVTISKSVNLTTAQPGDAITYTISFTNSGTYPATGVIITDLVSSNLFSLSTPDNSGANITASNTVSYAWEVDDLGPGDGGIITITGLITTQLTSPISLTNSVEITATEVDSDTLNNTSTVTTSIPARVDISVAKFDSDDPAIAKQPLTYTVRITNGGTSSSTNIWLTDTLPSTVTIASISSDQGSCTPSPISGQVVTCSFTTLGVTLVESTFDNNDEGWKVSGGSGTSTGGAAGIAVYSATEGVLPGAFQINDNSTADGDLTNERFYFFAPSKFLGDHSYAYGGALTFDIKFSNIDNTNVVDHDIILRSGGNTLTYKLLQSDTDTWISYVIPFTVGGFHVGQFIDDDIATESELFAILSNITGLEIHGDDSTNGSDNTTLIDNVAYRMTTAVDSVAIATVVVTPTEAGTIVNRAVVTTTDAEINTGNETTTESTTILSYVDLYLSKIESSDPITAGESITYTITVSNSGPSDALSVVITDQLPISLTNVISTSSDGSCIEVASQVISCTLSLVGVTAISGTESVTIVGTIPASVTSGAILTNTAGVTLTSTQTDSDLSNNSLTTPVTTTVTTEADLTISKTASSVSATVEYPFTYTIVITNNGPSDATAVILTDGLIVPTGTITRGTAIPDQGSCDTDDPFVCTLGTLTASEQITISWVVTPAIDAVNTVITNVVTATTSTPSVSVSYTDSITTNIVPQVADLNISKSVNPSNANPGDTITYTISFTNNGPHLATEVIITDTIPVSVNVTSVISNGTVAITDTDAVTPTYVFSVANMSINDTGMITVVGTLSNPLTAGTFTNTVEITTTTVDTDTNNNTAEMAIMVSGTAELTLTKSVDPYTNTTYHGAVTYTLVLSNNGTIDADPVYMTDTVPTSTTFDSFVQQNGATQSSGKITWDGLVTAGEAITVSFMVSHTKDYGDVITNDAEFEYNTVISISTEAVFTVTQQPVAVDDTYTTTEDIIVFNTSTGVITPNDTDPDGDTLVATVAVSPSHGVLMTFNNTGTFGYRPATSFAGTDYFTYTVSDGNGGVATATVTLVVSPTNDVPTIGQTTAWYDASLGTEPEVQGNFYTETLGSADRSTSGGQTVLSTTGNIATYAGYFHSPPTYTTVLTRDEGYALRFSAKVNAETHASDDRAGFSVLVVGDDLMAIELGFWTDQIWAQNSGTSEPPTGTLFTHGESVVFNTSTDMITYQLTISGAAYSLNANNTNILSGSLRNYQAALLANPVTGIVYNTPNLIFFGDNTPSASANVQIGFIDLITNTAPADRTVDTGQPLVITDVAVLDLDSDLSDVVVTLTVNSGTLELDNSVTNGVSNVSGDGTATVVMTGTTMQINNTLSYSPALTYTSNAGFIGTDTATVTINDQGFTGFVLNPLSDTKTFNIVVLGPSLVLTKTVNDDTPSMGDLITYTIVVSNGGLVDATGAAISDTMPTGLTFAGPVTLIPAQSGATLASSQADLPTLATGLTITSSEYITLTMPVTVNSNVAHDTLISNTAWVTSTEVMTTISDTVVITVSNEVDLVMSKSVTPTHYVGLGDTITYTLTFTNEGAGTALGVQITDTIPTSLTNLSVISSGLSITRNGTSIYLWDVQDMGVGDMGIITVSGQVAGSVSGYVTITNVATIGTTSVDTDTNSDAYTTTTRVSPLLITEIMYDPASPDTNFEWEWIELYNIGNTAIDLSGYVLDDDDYSALNTANITSGLVPASGSAVLFNVDEVITSEFKAAWGNSINLIPVGNWAGFANTSTGDRASLWRNITEYTGRNYDNTVDDVFYLSGSGGWPNPSGESIYLNDLEIDNNVENGWVLSTINGVTPVYTGYESINGLDIGSPGLAPPVLTITKTADPILDVTYHGEVTYTLTISNGGSGDASNAYLTDTLPISSTFSRWITQSGAVSTAGSPKQVTWNGLVTAGEYITISFVVSHHQTIGDYGDVITNAATISSTQATTVSNTATFTVEEGTPALTLTKTVNDVTDLTNVAYHGDVTYTIVISNGGTGNAVGTQFTDTLPISSTFQSWDERPSGTISNSGQITWTGMVTNDQAITFTFVVSHNGNYEDVVTNTAIISYAGIITESNVATFTVEPEPPSCWATIDNTNVYSSTDAQAVRDAINAASTNDTVKVVGYCAGVDVSANAVITINKSITVTGGYTHTNWTAYNPTTYTPTLSALGAGRVITVAKTGVTTPTVLLENLLVTNGKLTSNSSHGGGIHVNDANVTISGTTIYSNAVSGDTSQGGGIQSNQSITMTNSTVMSNTADGDGGGLYVADSGSAYLTGSMVVGNTSDNGDGGGLNVGGSAYLTGSTVSGNTTTTTYNGGGLYVYGSTYITGSRILQNFSTTDGGGVYAGKGGSIVNSLIAGNRADGEGEALFLFDSGIMNIVHTTIANPTVGTNAAIYVDHADVIANITNTIIASYTTGIEVGNGTVNENYNLFAGVTTIENGGITRGGSSIIGNAGFYDTTSYTLTNLSAAVSLGRDMGVTTDYFGEKRALGTSFDAGYDEVNYSTDLVIGKTASPDPVAAGGILTYTITITHAGNGGEIGGIVMTDTYPISVTATNTNSTGVTISETVSSGTRVYTVSNITSGQVATITIAGTVSSTLADGTRFTNTVEITSSNVQFDTTNDTAEAGVTANSAVLSVTKTVNDVTNLTNVARYGQVTYTIGISNGGVVDASGTYFSDTLPISSTFQSWIGIMPTDTFSGGGVISWTGKVTASEYVTFSFVVSHDGNYEDVVTNTAIISYAGAITESNMATFTVEPEPFCWATADNGGTVYRSADAQAVRDAIDKVSANGTVKVAGYCAGINVTSGYTAVITISKSITVTGGYTHADWDIYQPTVYTPTLDALGAGRVITIAKTGATTPTVLLENLYVTNGKLTSNIPGGGIHVDVNANLTISGSTIYSNAVSGGLSANGGGIYSNQSITMTRSTVMSNTATGDGGGLYVKGNAYLTGSTVMSNTATNVGGGLHVIGGNAYLTGSTVMSNTSGGDGGGLYVHVDAYLTGSTVMSNTSKGDGGGLAVYVDAYLTGSTVSGNTATGSGGGLKIDEGAYLTNSVVMGNIAGMNGGGLYIWGFTGAVNSRIVNSLIAGNSATNQGQAIYMEHRDDGGTDTTAIIHTTIASPTVGSGQAIYVADGTLNITNSIIASYTTGIANDGTVNENHNLFAGLTNNITNTSTVNRGGSSVTGNPAFYDTTSYTLTNVSAASDIGTNVGVSDDYFGNTRPLGGGYDAGYYESDYELDLQVSKSVNPSGMVARGTAITYSISFTASGTGGVASNIMLTDTVPVSINVTSVTSSTSNGAAITDTEITPSYVFSVANLALGDSGMITIVGTVSTTMSIPDTFTNTAIITMTTVDSDTTNNTASVGLSVDDTVLSITKRSTYTGGRLLPGNQITYTIVVTNSGGLTATTTTVSDTMPISLTYASISGTGANITANPVLAWDIGTLTPSTSITLSYVAVVTNTNILSGALLTNTASITSTEVPTETYATVTNTVVYPVAELEIDKQRVGSGEVVAGQSVTYTISLTNSGTDAVDVVITDSYTGTVSGVISSTSAGSCASSGPITCTISGFTGTETITVVLTTGSFSDTLTNTVAVSFATGVLAIDTDPVDDTDEVTTTVRYPTADLQVSKARVGSGDVLAGQEITYTLTITNDGPDTVGVVITDTFTGGTVSSIISTTSTGTCAGTGPVTCTIASLTNTETITMIMTTGSFSNTFTNTAQISFTAGLTAADTNPGNNTSNDITTTVRFPTAELSVSKARVGSGDVLAGQEITYTLTITNDGPDTVGVVITDTFTGGTVSSIISSTSTGTCAGTGPVTCTIASLTNTETITVIMTTGSFSNTFTNTAQISFTAGLTAADTNPNNNTSTDITATVRYPTAELSVSKQRVSPASVFAGESITYTITITNEGPDDPNVVITDTFTGTVTSIISSTTGGGTCSGTGPVVCNFTEFTDTETITMVMTTGSFSGTLTNTAFITVAGGITMTDNPTDNSSTDITTTVRYPEAELQISKQRVGTGVVYSGGQITYTVTITNDGPDSPDVIITDTFTSGAITVTSVTGNGLCSTGSSPITCTFSSFTNTEIITVVLTTGSSFSNTVTNTAQITASGNITMIDSDLGNNGPTTTISTTVRIPTAELQVSKQRIGSATVLPGKPITFTITITNGPGNDTASQVVVTDIYTQTTAGLVTGVISQTTGGGTCTLSASPLVCTFNNFTNTEYITFVMINDGTKTGLISNSASITFHNTVIATDTNLANNGPTAVVTASVEATDIRITKAQDKATPSQFENVVYTISVNKNVASLGLDDAAVVISDSIPAGMTYISHVASAGAYNDGTGVWDGFTVTSTVETLQITAKATGAPGTVITNVARITKTTPTDIKSSNDAATQTLTIKYPILSFANEPYSIAEDDTGATLTVTVQLNVTSTSQITVNYTVANGSASLGSDYDNPTGTGTLTFTTGVTEQTFSIPITDDLIYEGNETVNIQLSDATNATIATDPLPTTMTIVENESSPIPPIPPTLQVGVNHPDFPTTGAVAYTVDEGGGTVMITVTMWGATDQTVEVDYYTIAHSAIEGQDYTVQTGTLTLSAATPEVYFTIPILQDSRLEGPEAFEIELNNLRLISGDSYVVLVVSDEDAPITIVDDDLPTVSLNASQTVSETVNTVMMTATLSITYPVAVTVDYSTITTGSTATAGTDYTTTNGTLTIPAGAISATFSVPIVNDTIQEATETVMVALSNPVYATLGNPSQTSISIVDDDAPTVQFAQTTYSVDEDNGPATIEVTLSKAPSLTVTVNYATSDGSALVGATQDYLSASGTLIFTPSGGTNRSFMVDINNDSVVEPDETVNLTLSSPNNGTLGIPATATLTIVNDDTIADSPQLSLASSSITVDESSGQVMIIVTLNQTSSQPITVSYGTANQTAMSGSDYTGISGILTFAPSPVGSSGGITLQTFMVSILPDAFDEANETFSVSLINAGNAVIFGNSQTIVTITDDDPPVAVNVSSAAITANEGDMVTIQVDLSAVSGLTVTVPYSTVAGLPIGSPGSAMPGLDYSPISGTLTFPPGTTSLTITVPILSDTLTEPDERFGLLLTGATNATLGATNQTVVTITGFTIPTIQFSTTSYTVDEGVGQAMLTVKLGSPVTDTVTVNIATDDSTSARRRSAVKGQDYESVNRTLNITAGLTELTVPITIIDDTLIEPTEHVTVSLSSPVRAVLAGTYSTTLYILDNDSTTITELIVINDGPTTLGFPTSFTATVTGGQPVTFSWSFGDGNTGSGGEPSHTYALSGVYTVVVTATNNSSVMTDTTVVMVTELVTNEVELAVSKLTNMNPTVVNQPLSYTIVVTNNGPGLANNVTITDSLPVSVSLLSGDVGCSGTTMIVCDLGSLSLNETVSRTIVVSPTETGIIVNSVMVGSDPLQTDLNLANNSSTISTTVVDGLVLLQPEVGGTLTITNPTASTSQFIVQSDTITEPIVLVYTKLPDLPEPATSIPAGYNFADHAFKLEFYQGGQLLTDYQLNEAMQFIVGYDSSQVDSTLTLMMWNGSEWVPATATCTPPTNSVVDTEANQLSLTVCQAPGQFALFNKPVLYLPIIIRSNPVSTPTATSVPVSNAPDLSGSFSLTPNQSSFTTADEVLITVVVTNQGTARADSFWVDLFINPSSEPAEGNAIWNELCTLTPCYGLAWHVTGGLNPGESVTLTSTAGNFSADHTIWSGQFAAGTSDLYLYVDTWSPERGSAGLVSESDETNNRAELHGLSVTGSSPRDAVRSVVDIPRLGSS